MTRRAGLVLAALVQAATLTACVTAPATVGDTASLTGEDLSGTPHDLKDHRGQVVVVTVWASWCAPCRDEVPVLRRAIDALGPAGLQVLGINFRDDPGAAATFAREAGIDYPSIVDPDGAKSIDWGVTGIPQTFLVSRDGIVVDRVSGAVTDEWIRETVAPEVKR